jgi:hypothetical protein
VSLNGQPVIMQAHTGAYVSVTGEHLYKSVSNGVPLSPASSMHWCAGCYRRVLGVHSA